MKKSCLGRMTKGCFGFLAIISSDVCLDRAGRGLPGRRRRAVRAELRDRRYHRRLRPGVAPAGGGMVCAPHHLPPDSGTLNRDIEESRLVSPSRLSSSSKSDFSSCEISYMDLISDPPASGMRPASSWPPGGGNRKPPGPCR